MKIIHSTIFKLTLSYLGIIMMLSIGFSLFIYRTYNAELTRGFNRQGLFFNEVMPRGIPGLDQFRRTQLTETHQRLANNLFLFNLLVLIAGGAGSYFLAKWTLRPIEEAMEAQNRFVSDASHELRTPLTAMQTEIEVGLRDESRSKESAELILQSNLEEIGKLKLLTEGLLRLGQNLPTENFDLMSLKDISTEAVNKVVALATKRDIVIDNKVDNIKLRGSDISLTELLVILLDNAIKYSGPKTTIKITSYKQDNFAYIKVADQGQGISKTDLPHIFDRFYRSDLSRSKKESNGYGLGLSIAKKIVEDHKGTIKAKSTPGKGSTFTIKIPL